MSDELPELLVKMTQVIKAAVITNIDDAEFCIEQKLTGIVNFYLVQIFEYGQTGGRLEKAAY
jgi:hypothetical protein